MTLTPYKHGQFIIHSEFFLDSPTGDANCKDWIALEVGDPLWGRLYCSVVVIYIEQSRSQVSTLY